MQCRQRNILVHLNKPEDHFYTKKNFIFKIKKIEQYKTFIRLLSHPLIFRVSMKSFVSVLIFALFRVAFCGITIPLPPPSNKNVDGRPMLSQQHGSRLPPGPSDLAQPTVKSTPPPPPPPLYWLKALMEAMEAAELSPPKSEIDDIANPTTTKSPIPPPWLIWLAAALGNQIPPDFRLPDDLAPPTRSKPTTTSTTSRLDWIRNLPQNDSVALVIINADKTEESAVKRSQWNIIIRPPTKTTRWWLPTQFYPPPTPTKTPSKTTRPPTYCSGSGTDCGV